MILFTYNTTLSRSIRRFGEMLSADFNVVVSVHREGDRLSLSMAANERVPYYDRHDNPCSEIACVPGQLFTPLDSDERERLGIEAQMQYDAWLSQLPEFIEPDFVQPNAPDEFDQRAA